jgi:cytochrome c-type biogenesis protein CcmE/HAMP domain-containing protein
VLELVLGAVAATIGLILVWLTALGVTRPILRVAAMLKDIAVGEGDLTHRLVYTRQDELGELVGWFNRFLDKLQPVIAEVKRLVQEARNTADQSAIIANQTSSGMEQQYREVDQVATASQEMTASAHEVARSAAQAADRGTAALPARRGAPFAPGETTVNAVRKKRLYIVLAILVGAGIAVGLALMALNQNINLFYTPTQIANGEAPQDARIRAGGMVAEGSLKRSGDSLDVEFVVTDFAKSVTIRYRGILPDLFREGQGIVALGKLNADGVLIADEVLAKHDENYMPPEVTKALKDSGQLQPGKSEG